MSGRRAQLHKGSYPLQKNLEGHATVTVIGLLQMFATELQARIFTNLGQPIICRYYTITTFPTVQASGMNVADLQSLPACAAESLTVMYILLIARKAVYGKSTRAQLRRLPSQAPHAHNDVMSGCPAGSGWLLLSTLQACAGGLMQLKSRVPSALLGTHRLRNVAARGLLLRAGGLQSTTGARLLHYVSR